MINIYYNKEEDIVYWEISENIYKEDLLKSIDQIVNLVEKGKGIRVLHTVKNVTANFSVTENVKNALYAKKYFSYYSSIKIAFVTEKPRNLAFFILGIK